MSKETLSYSKAKWKGEPRTSAPLCVRCNSEKLNTIRVYLVNYTETYKDYECLRCGYRFTIDWS